MKKPISVILVLILSLSLIFSVPAGLFFFNAKAQGASSSLITPTAKTPLPLSRIPIPPSVTQRSNPLVSSGISPFLNPNQQQQLHQPSLQQYPFQQLRPQETTIAPSTSTAVDRVPPDTQIISAIDGSGEPVQNGGTTLSDKIAFVIQGTDNVAVASFQCSLDNAQAYVCIGPVILNNLQPGVHELQVRAVDAGGNADSTPASFRWNVYASSHSSSPGNNEIISPLNSLTSQTPASSASKIPVPQQNPQQLQPPKSLSAPVKEIMTVPSQITKRSNQSPASAAAGTCSADLCVNPGETATFQVACSNPDSRVVVTCIMTSGPKGATFSSTTGNPAVGTMTWPNAGPPGTYQASFQAITVSCPSDIRCVDSPVKTFTILVNHPPVANAGSDQTVTSGDTVTLQGSGTDADNDPLTYSWTQTAGPSVTLSDESSATPTFTAPQVDTETTLTFQLIVNDGMINSNPASVNVVIKPECGCSSTQQSLLSSSGTSTAGTAGSCTPATATGTTKNVNFIGPTPRAPLVIQASSLQQVHDLYHETYPDGLALTESLKPIAHFKHDQKTGLVSCNSFVNVQIVQDMPIFPGVKKLSAAAQNEWKRFLAALTVHENGHVSIIKDGVAGGVKYGVGYNGVVSDMVGQDDAGATAILDQRTADVQTASDNYDTATGHGASQGAVLCYKPPYKYLGGGACQQ